MPADAWTLNMQTCIACIDFAAPAIVCKDIVELEVPEQLPAIKHREKAADFPEILELRPLGSERTTSKKHQEGELQPDLEAAHVFAKETDERRRLLDTVHVERNDDSVFRF